MQACINRKGQIADAAEVGLSSANSPYVCVLLRGRWQWQPVKEISGNTFKDVRGQMYKYIHNALQNKNRGEKQHSIMIGNCTTSTASIINGRWDPRPDLVKEGEFNVYACGDKRLYCVKKRVGHVAAASQESKYEWWIGTQDNLNERKGWGFFRQKTPTTNSIAPWQVNIWMAWNKPVNTAGSWIRQALPIKIEKIDTDWEINKAIENKTKDLVKQTRETIDSCNAVMNSSIEMMKNHKEVSRELFNKLTKEKRLAVVDTSKFRAIFRKDDLCSCCFSDAKTTKCIHHDCTGACAKCRGDNEDADCCACGKKQVLECPICQGDNFPPSFMKMFGCKHGVCYKCYSIAYELKRQLKKCPLCRVPIVLPPE